MEFYNTWLNGNNEDWVELEKSASGLPVKVQVS